MDGTRLPDSVDNGRRPFYVAAVDVGTTIVRCHVYDAKANIIGQAKRGVKLTYPKPGYVEIHPDCLWDAFVSVVSDAIKDAKIASSQLAGIGIATLRATFMTWHRISGKPFHNFIVWNDTRADELVRLYDSSLMMKAIILSFDCMLNAKVLMRLVWMLNNVAAIRENAQDGNVMFGTVDTWLLWKLTGGQEHATDYSNASSTALYDPFLLQWGSWAFKMFSIPSNMMPHVKDTSGHFGNCLKDIFGCEIPILALVGDQQAAMFGQCCFEVGDVKCTMGTGTFLNMNTGGEPHASVAGLYPLVGWKIGSDVVYLAEGSANDTGTIVNWMQSVGLLRDPRESSELAQSVDDSGGVTFVPGSGGLQAPINGDRGCASIVGLRSNTSAAQIVRAVLESLAYTVERLHRTMTDEVNFRLNFIRIDGGVSANDFVVQQIADFTGRKIDRAQQTDMTCLGVAFLAGLAGGLWSSLDELKMLRRTERIFEPLRSQSTTTSFKAEACSQCGAFVFPRRSSPMMV